MPGPIPSPQAGLLPCAHPPPCGRPSSFQSPVPSHEPQQTPLLIRSIPLSTASLPYTAVLASPSSPQRVCSANVPNCPPCAGGQGLCADQDKSGGCSGIHVPQDPSRHGYRRRQRPSRKQLSNCALRQGSRCRGFMKRMLQQEWGGEKVVSFHSFLSLVFSPGTGLLQVEVPTLSS